MEKIKRRILSPLIIGMIDFWHKSIGKKKYDKPFDDYYYYNITHYQNHC